MHTHLVSSVAAVILLLNTTYAGQTTVGQPAKPVSKELNPRTGEWKSVEPKSVGTNKSLTPAQGKVRRTPWSWQRAAMQPIRFIVMIAKVPLIPAGIVGLAVGCPATGQPVPDLAPAFENFDPGPAIDADLERKVPKIERRPAPLDTRLKIFSATPAASGRSSVAREVAINRQKPTRSIPINAASTKPSPAEASGQELAGVSPLVAIVGPNPNFDH